MKPTLVTCLGTMAVVSAWAVGQSLSPAMKQKQARTLVNARQVTFAVLMYAGDADDVMPLARSTEQAKTVLAPYSKSTSIWKSENPGSRLLFNVKTSEVPMTAFREPMRVPVVYDSKAWTDGTRVVGYVDGHGRVEPKAKWPAIQAMLKKKWRK